MALDFVKHINDNWNVTSAKKVAFLNDFCSQYGYQDTDEEGNPNPLTKKQFANQVIAQYFKEAINSYRRGLAIREVQFEELDGDFVAD